MRHIMSLSLFILLLSSAGNSMSDPPVEEWVARYDGPGNYDDYAYDIALDAEGNIVIAGASYGGIMTDYDFVTVKYDSEGIEQWVRRYDGPGAGWDEAYAVAVDDSCSVYVTGWCYSASSSYDFATVKYDSDGNQEWVSWYDGPAGGFDAAMDIAFDGYGFVYVTGCSEGGLSGYDYATVKYDTVNGDEEWVLRYNGTANIIDEPSAMTVDSIGNAIVTGSSCIQNSYCDYATIMYSKDGYQLWCTTYNGQADNIDIATGIARAQSGYIYVTGASYVGSVYDRDFVTIQIDPEGNHKWTAVYNGPDSDTDYAEAVEVDDQGNIYVTGESVGVDTYYDYATVKYDFYGAEQWVARYNGTADDDDEAYAMAVDPGGNVYVTGYTTNDDDNSDYATIMYDTDGTEQWVMLYDGPAGDADEACGIVVDDQGNVYVTGYSYGIGTDIDCLTIKYSPYLGTGPAEGTAAAELLPIWPNPGIGAPTVRYSLRESATVSIGIYDIQGRLVQERSLAEQVPGSHHVRMEDLSSGVYFCRLDTGAMTLSRSFVVLR